MAGFLIFDKKTSRNTINSHIMGVFFEYIHKKTHLLKMRLKTNNHETYENRKQSNTYV